jgi:lactobin A/cerein 7B family class IIb bacteriocin
MQQLSEKQMQEVQGGFWPFVILWGCIMMLVGPVVAVVAEFEPGWQ